MKAVWSEDTWIQEHQTKPEQTDEPVEVADSNVVETVAKKSKPQVRKIIYKVFPKNRFTKLVVVSKKHVTTETTVTADRLEIETLKQVKGGSEMYAFFYFEKLRSIKNYSTPEILSKGQTYLIKQIRKIYQIIRHLNRSQWSN